MVPPPPRLTLEANWNVSTDMCTPSCRSQETQHFTPVSVRVRGTGKEAMKVYVPPPEACRTAARLLLLQDAQTGISEGGLEGLATETRKIDQGGSRKRGSSR